MVQQVMFQWFISFSNLVFTVSMFNGFLFQWFHGHIVQCFSGRQRMATSTNYSSLVCRFYMIPWFYSATFYDSMIQLNKLPPFILFINQ